MTPFILRRWQESDIPALAKYLNNKKIWDNCRDSLPYPYTSEDAASFIQYVKSQDIQNNYCIEVHAEAAGNISFDRGTDVERFNAEIGYWLAEPYWNKGIMTQKNGYSTQCLFQEWSVFGLPLFRIVERIRIIGILSCPRQKLPIRPDSRRPRRGQRLKFSASTIPGGDNAKNFPQASSPAGTVLKNFCNLRPRRGQH